MTISAGVITDPLRAALEERRADLVSKLETPISDRALRFRLSRLFSGFTQMHGWEKSDAMLLMDECLARLGRYSEWVLVETFHKCRMNLERDMEKDTVKRDPADFPPTATGLQSIAESVERPWRHELHELGKVLDAKPVPALQPETPEHREAAIRRLWEEGARLEIPEPESVRTRQEIAAKIAAGTDKMILRDLKARGIKDARLLSPELRAKLNKMGAKLPVGAPPKKPMRQARGPRRP
jgi:hypothetical protein